MAGRFGILGCGYVGSAVARSFRGKGFELTGTTTSPERLADLATLVDHPRVFDLGDATADHRFLDELDGLLIAVAPKQGDYCPEQYRALYCDGIDALARLIRRRRASSPLHITYLSSSGVYGNQRGDHCHEDRSPDLSSEQNAALVSAERAILALRTGLVSCSVLRLGGIYGPGLDVVSMIRSAAGRAIAKNGDHVNAWVHRDDIVRGIDFAFRHRLNGTYNLVDDLRLSRRELSSVLCEANGLPPVIWDSFDRPGSRVFNARVSNARLKSLGFKLQVPSMLSLMPA